MSNAPLPPLHEDEGPIEQSPRPTRWKRVVAWVAAGIALLILLIVIAVVVLLRTAAFREYVLRTAQEKATAALGSPVQVRDFALHWSDMSPSLDVYGVVVYGAKPYPTPPLLQIEHVNVQLRITSLLRRTWYLNSVSIDRPVVRVFVDRDGIDNLPQTKSTGQKSQTSVFDLGVRHARLQRGEVYYNNRKSVLEADLHDLSFQSAFDTARHTYTGALGYRDGDIRVENFNPVVHSLDARFTATPQAFTLERAVLSSGRSQLVLKATLNDYARPRIDATYEATIDTGQFRRVMKNPSLPAGVIRAAGSLQYVSEPNRPMLETLTLNGDLSSRALVVQTSSFRGDIRDLAARYSLAKGTVEVRDMRARLLGGEMSGTMTMRDITGASRSRLQVALRNLSLAELKSLMTSPSMQQVALAGSVNAAADATWGKTFSDLVARTDATLNARLAPAAQPTAAVAVNGAIHARYAAAGKQISLAQSFVRTSQTSLTLNGTVSEQSRLQVLVQSNDLHELETLADSFRPSASGQRAAPLGLYGTASFAGAVTGSTAAPRITGRLTAANLRAKNTSWRLLRADVELSPSMASLQNGIAQPADRGQIAFNLRAGLRHWSFTETSPVEMAVNATQVNVADLTKAAGLQTPVTGTLAASISLRGSELSPVGQGTVRLTQAKVGAEPIQSLNANFQGTGNEVHSNIVLAVPAGVANLALTYFPRQQGYDAQLRASGIRLDQLQAVKARNLQLSGVLDLVAGGRGTLKNPQLQATAQVPALTIRDQKISGLTLQTTVANHVASLALDSQVVNTYARARGTVNLTGNYYANATLDTQAIPLAPLVAIYAPAQAGDIAGQTELHASLRGPLKDRSQMDAHATIPVLQVSYKNTIQLAAADPIHVDYSNGVLQLQRATIRGTGTDLQFQASIPTNSAAPASLLLLGSIDLRLAEMIDPDISSSGQLRLNIDSYGRRSDPSVQGQVQIVNASFATGNLPIGLQNGNGVLTLTKNRLNITQFQGNVGGGTLRASGGVVYRPSLQFDLALAGNGVRLLYPEGVRAQLDTQLALSGSSQAAILRGDVRIDQLSFTPDFDLQQFIGQFSGETTPPPARGFSQNLQLDIGVQSAGGVNLVSRTLSVQGAANLRVSGTAAQPVVLGRVNLSGGELLFMGNRYVLQGGTVDFASPVRTEPVVNLGVDTTIQQYNIHIRLWGPADHLYTSYASDPALPPADIINLIVTGQTTEAAEAASTSATPGNLGAQALIASAVSGQVTSRVAKIAGISQLSIDPVLGGGRQNPGARVAIEQRVTSKIFVTFVTDVTSTQSRVLKLEYEVSPRFSVSATRDQNGGFGFDTRIHKKW